MTLLARGVRFYAVGALGIVVQLAALAALQGWMHYLVATALAVEIAVVHNYLWHERWTWADRPGGWGAFARFHLTTGLVSVVGNLVVMRVLTGALGVRPLAANAVAVALVSVANFLAAEHLAFRRG